MFIRDFMTTSSPAQIFTVGTKPVLILNGNPRRFSYTIIMLASNIASGNTGLVFIGQGFDPTATVGGQNSGHAMAGGDVFGETKSALQDAIFNGSIYAVASVADQIIEVFEVVE